MLLRTYGILVVDDEAGVRGVLNISMRQQGFAVWLAADAREALDLYRRHRETIDVVLLDVLMPGLDGPQTLAALREVDPQLCFCFMSGNFGSYTEERLRHLGAATLFAKPFRLAEVGQVLWGLAVSARRGRSGAAAKTNGEERNHDDRSTERQIPPAAGQARGQPADPRQGEDAAA